MRQVLDGLYSGGLILACGAMATTAALVLAQIAGRILDRVLVAIGAVPLGLAVPSLAEIGGFLFVAAAMLALPAALRAGAHVRVTVMSGLLGPGPAGRLLELVVLASATALSSFAAWHSAAQMLDSLAFDSVSYGMVRVPLWIPQGAMTLGLALFVVSLVDDLVASIRGQVPAFRRAEAARGTKAE